METPASERVAERVGHTVEQKLAVLGWRIMGGFLVSIVLAAVAWGSLYRQVQQHEAILHDGTTLTEKDKENLQNQINAMNESIQQLRNDVQSDLGDIKRDIREIRNILVAP